MCTDQRRKQHVEKNYFTVPLVLVALSGFLAATPAQADEVYSCQGQNSAMHFIIYENGDTPRGGHMYLNNLQTAVLDAWRVNQHSIRARVAGNTADTQIVLNKARRQIYIEIGNTSRELCDARVLEN